MMIGITPRWTLKYENKISFEFEKEYFDYFNQNLKIKLVPIIPTELSEINYLDGLVLSGGNDLPIFSNNKIDSYRHKYETKLLDKARSMQIPILGICRGMQLLAYISGAALYKLSGHVSVIHPITVHDECATKLSRVNSYHNYVVGSIPEKFGSLVLDANGCVEMFVSNCNRELGIMWHPEREYGSDETLAAYIRRHFMGVHDE